MREIKFRCFDNEQKKIFGVYGFDEYHVYENSLDDYSKSVHPINVCELMQYTGLKDDLGKEIYEGDVVTYDTDIGQEIVYKDCAFTFKNTEMPLGRFRQQAMIVIGNIYENPELLEATKRQQRHIRY